MNAPFHVTCAIPRSGRTLNNFLQKLVDLGASSEEIDAILQILSQSKSRSSLKLEEALNFLEEVRTKAPSCFSVFVDGGGPWKSDRFKGFVTILFYVDPDESDLNNAASEALKDANLPADQVRSVAVINMDATLLPNFLIQGKLEDKQKEYQNTLYVMDYKKVLVNEWGLGDHNNDVVIFDKQGKVLFSVDGQLNDSQIKQMLAAVKSGFN
jgi:predicted transcriptional regulator